MSTTTSQYATLAAANSPAATLLFRSATTVTLFALFAAPLAFGAVESWAWTAMCGLFVLSFGLLVMGFVARGAISIELSAGHLLILSTLAVGCLQLWTGATGDAIGTRESLLKLGAAFLLFTIIASLFDGSTGGKQRLEWLACGIAGYVLLMAVFAISQYLSAPGMLFWTFQPKSGGAVFGSYVNHNHFAGFMELLLPIAAASYFSTPRQAIRPLLLLGVLVGFASILLSGSRTGAVVIAIEAALILFAVAKFHPSARRTILIASLGILVTLAGVFFYLDRGAVRERWQASMTATELTADARVTIAKDSLQMFKEHPFLGVGLGAFEAAYPSVQSLRTDSTVDHAHNDYAELLAEAGIVGAILAAIALVVLCRKLSQRVFRVGQTADWIRTGACIGCFGFMVHALFDFNVHIPANAAWFTFAAALVMARVPTNKEIWSGAEVQ